METNLGSSLSSLLESAINTQSEESKVDKGVIISKMAAGAGIDEGTVNQIVSGDIKCPPMKRLAGLAKALSGVTTEQIETALNTDGCSIEPEEMETEKKTFREKISDLLNLSEEVAVEKPVEAPVETPVVLMEDGDEAPEAPVAEEAPFSDDQLTAIKGIVEDVINELAGGVEDAPVVDMTEAPEVLAAVEVEEAVELEAVVEPIKPSPTKEATNTLKFKIGDKRKASRQDFINSQIFQN